MPELPVFRNPAATPRPGAPVLDREPRPRVNAGGLQSAIGQVAASARGSAMAQHMTPATAGHFGGERGAAAGAIAQGVAAVGQMLAGLHQRELDARNYADRSEANAYLKQVYADFETWKMESAMGRPETWRPELERRMERAMTELQKRGYSPMVQEQVAVDGQQFAANAAIRAQTDAVKESFRRAGAAADAKVQTGVLTGNRALVDEGLAEKAEYTGATPEELALEKLQAERQMDRADVQRLIDQDPQLVLDLLSGAEDQHEVAALKGLSLGERNDVQQQALAAIAKGKALVFEQARHDLVAGALVTADQFIAEVNAGRRDPGFLLSDEEIQQFAQSIGRVDNDPVLYGQVLAEIANYDARNDPHGFAAATIRRGIAEQFDKEFGNELRQRLDAQADRTAVGGGSALDREYGVILNHVQGYLESGRFGDYAIPVHNAGQRDASIWYDNDRDRWMRAPFPWEDDEPVPIRISQEDARQLTIAVDNSDVRKLLENTIITDLDARTDAAARAEQVRRALEEGREAGRITTPQEMHDEAERMLEEHLGEAARQALRAPMVIPPRMPGWLDLGFDARMRIPQPQPVEAPPPMAPGIGTEGDLPPLDEGGLDETLFDSLMRELAQ